MEFIRFNDLAQQGSLAQQRVFIRADLNVPVELQDGQMVITDDTRIRASVPAIATALKSGAAVMVTSHLGRPTEGSLTDQDSLAPIAKRLSELLGQPVVLAKDWLDSPPQIKVGEVVLLENCRGNVGEKKNAPELAQKMAALCDVFVNDAFGTAHRAEATTHGIAQYAKIACAGPLMTAELEALGKALANPKRPLAAIVAGSKVSTKLTILQSLSQKVDVLIVGGGICNTFMAAAGLPIGKSLAELDLLDEAKTVMAQMRARGAEVPLPIDVVVGKNFAAHEPAVIKKATDVAPDEMIFDIGPETAKVWGDLLKNAGTIVWNGPVGVFEFDQFGQGTKTLAQSIADSNGFSIAGGGDTIAAINKYQVTDKIDYISTAGGAFLEFLEGKALPAVAILEQRAASQ